MAIVSATVWEVRVAGSANNGSGFNNRIPGTSVDYSQQNASQLSKADLACAAASVTVTSATNGFTNAMVGNVMRIRAGNNFTVGFYEIVQFNGVGSVNLDRVPVTAIGSNGVAEVGGAQINLDLIDTVAVPGNTIWIKSGSYAAHPAVTFNQLYTSKLPLTIIGYNAARGDNPTGANRPIIQMVAAVFTIQDFGKIRNVRFTGSGTQVINWTSSGGSFCSFMDNCYIESTAVAGSRYCIENATYSSCYVDCEFVGTAGATSSGIRTPAGTFYPRLFVLNCYFHNLTNGILCQNNISAYIIFNIFANLGNNGINFISTGDGGEIANNTFAGIGRSGIYSPSATKLTVVAMNNSFSDCVVAGIEAFIALVMNNNFFGCGTPWIGGTLNLENNNTFVNPQFVTPGSNYALQRTSGLIDRAFSMRLGV